MIEHPVPALQVVCCVPIGAGALWVITPGDAAGWFDHCGYEVEVQYL